MRIKEMQDYARYLSEKHGWDKEPLATRLKYLKSEFKEVTDEINAYLQTDSDEEREDIRKSLGHELHDMIWNIADIANRFNIDLEKACEEKKRINERRTFSDEPSEVQLDIEVFDKDKSLSSQS